MFFFKGGGGVDPSPTNFFFRQNVKHIQHALKNLFLFKVSCIVTPTVSKAHNVIFIKNEIKVDFSTADGGQSFGNISP